MKTHTAFAIFFLFLASGIDLMADDFFSVRGVKYLAKPGKENAGVWVEVTDPKTKKKQRTFQPCLEVQVQVRETFKAADTFARVHLYDQNRNLLTTIPEPSKATRGKGKDFASPVFYNAGERMTLYFALPDKFLSQRWSAVVVFGDKHGATVGTLPSSLSLFGLDFPERMIVEGKVKRTGERKAALDPVTAHVIKTGNPKQPQITLFVRPPIGMTDGSQAKGVLAMCLLAGSPDEIKRKLQRMEPGEEVGGLIGFAEKHQLAILAWGSRTLWNPKMSHDELNRQINRELDETFDDVAKAWEKGVKELSQKYGLPEGNFLLWGQSGSAQYACRLALRKPQYFLAVHAHIPSSFDKPTAEANQVLWLLSTGEKEGGYPAAKRFFMECRSLGYPIIFKGVPGLGHSGSALTSRLGLQFFEYALSIQDEKAAFLKQELSPLNRRKSSDEPWPEDFRTPAFVGDIQNQDFFPGEDEDVIPAVFRVALPTEAIANSWKK